MENWEKDKNFIFISNVNDRCIGISLIRYIEDINEEKYKFFLKGVKEGLNNWRKCRVYGWKYLILEK